MLKALLENEAAPKEPEHGEGELYGIVTVYGRQFELRYGFYEERDRLNPLCKPVPIYPDLFKDPIYTDGGEPIVTAMQDACRRYRGEQRHTADSTCAECRYFNQGEDRFGVCGCPKNKRQG